MDISVGQGLYSSELHFMLIRIRMELVMLQTKIVFGIYFNNKSIFTYFKYTNKHIFIYIFT